MTDRLFEVDADQLNVTGTREDLERFASISHCGSYRFALSRAWTDQPERYVMFVGLNPSTADGMVEDPTLRRCIGFARAWGYDGLWLGNLYALRATDPRELRRDPHPVAPPVVPHQTANWLRRMRDRSELVVACWGADPAARARVPAVLELLGDVHALKLTKSGAPGHPLYLRADARPTPWTQEAAA